MQNLASFLPGNLKLPNLLTLMLRPHGQNKRKSGYGFWPQVLSSSYSLYLSLSFCSCMIYPDYSCADHNCYPTPSFHSLPTTQRYTYGVLQTIQIKLILLFAWVEQAVLGIAKTALKFQYEI